MRSTRHILVINGTKVRRPVFVLGAPHSGTELLARAIKQSPRYHLTAGRPGVLRVTYAFARRPGIAIDRERGAARVLRDAYAEAWQMTPQGCAQCPAECPAPGFVRTDEEGRPRLCVEPRGVERFADASPDLLYSADVLLDAFPDAQLLQVIRDGRAAVADMLADERCLAWFKPGFANLEEVFPNPFLGVEDFTEKTRWPDAAMAVKCALRWRGSVRLSAKLRAQTPDDQLYTVRYEDLLTRPGRVAGEVSDYLGTPVSRSAVAGLLRPADREARERALSGWRERLTQRQLKQVEKVAGTELRRLGYRLSVT